MKIRAAVLERTGGPLTVTELDLAEPGPGEVRVRLHASGVCHSDQNAIDGGGRERIKLEGDIPSAAAPPSGCVFHTRCPRVLGAVCEETEPPLVEAEPGHLMRCHIPLAELRRLQKSPSEEVTA